MEKREEEEMIIMSERNIYQLMNFIYQKKSLDRIPQFVYQMSVGVNLIRDRPLRFSNSAFFKIIPELN